MRALIAEDNAVNRELLRELLELDGYDVEETCNGQEALKAIAASTPDVVLLDIGMAVLDGYATIRKIRENSSWAGLPVLCVTAYAMQGDRENILNAGFDGYLSKPIDAKALKQELHRLLNKTRAALAP